MNADGMNTAHSTSAIATSAAPTSSMLRLRRVARAQALGDVALDILDHDDGVIDDDADGKHEAEQRQVVQREAERRHQEEGADQRHRNGDQRNDGGAPGLQEQHDHQNDQQDRLEDRLHHGVDRLLDELGRVVDDVVFEPLRKPLGRIRHGLADVLGGGERIRARALEYRDRDRRIEVEIGVRRIVEAGELGAADILEPHHRVRRLLDDDIGELLGIGEPAERLHRDLERARLLDRRLVEDARGDLDVLRLQRLGDVVRRHAERLQAGGIEPDPHRIVAAAEHDDRADAIDARQRVLDLQRGVVGDEQFARATCRATACARPSSGRTMPWRR